MFVGHYCWTIWNLFKKLHCWVCVIEMMHRKQERQLSLFQFCLVTCSRMEVYAKYTKVSTLLKIYTEIMLRLSRYSRRIFFLQILRPLVFPYLLNIHTYSQLVFVLLFCSFIFLRNKIIPFWSCFLFVVLRLINCNLVPDKIKNLGEIVRDV